MSWWRVALCPAARPAHFAHVLLVDKDSGARALAEAFACRVEQLLAEAATDAGPAGGGGAAAVKPEGGGAAAAISGEQWARLLEDVGNDVVSAVLLRCWCWCCWWCCWWWWWRAALCVYVAGCGGRQGKPHPAR